MERIGFGPRFGAYIIDIVLASVVAGILSVVLGSAGAVAGAQMGDLSGMSGEEAQMTAGLGGLAGILAGAVLGVGIGFTVYFLIEAFTGYTLGKLILGIQVGTAEGKKGTMSVYMVRYAIKNAGSIFMLLSAITSLSIFGTLGNLATLAIFIGCFFVMGVKRQSFHDLIAKTAVYRKKDLDAAPID